MRRGRMHERHDAGERPPFGPLLKQYRLAAGLSQEQVAERAALSTDAISALERGARRAPYRETVQRIAAALGLPPEEAARLHAAVARGRRGALAGPAVATSPPLPSYLPSPPTPLIGRDGEVNTVRALLGGEGRLLTLTGIGGVGKTLLALHVAGAEASAYPDGALFVELAAVRDPALVVLAVAQALGLRGAVVTPVDALCAALTERRALLLLDNCEHMLEAVATLAAALLAACPYLRILATSRAALRLRGERVYPVPPLAAPAPNDAARPEELAQVPAVALLLERTRAALPEFALTQENAGAVAAVCRRLEGLPLALELAAPRLAVLAPGALLARLERRLSLRAGGSRDLPERQRTLRATLAWSYTLLSPGEQAVFQRLAVCTGGATVEAAEAICAGNDLPGDEVMDWLAELVDKSLLRRTVASDGAVRVTMLETVREYALERLEESGETAETRRRHAAYYLTLVEEAEPELAGPAQAVWLARLEVEYANLRTALDWAQERNEGVLGLRLAGALWRFWQARGYLSEGRRWLDVLLARSGSGLPMAAASVRAKALQSASLLAYRQGDDGPAGVLAEESLRLYREVGDSAGSATSLNLLGGVATDLGDYGRATALYEESLVLRRGLGDRRGIAIALGNLANVAYHQGDHRQAGALAEESLCLYREAGDSVGSATSLNLLGCVAADHGDYGRAAVLQEESLALCRAVGDKWLAAYCLEGLAGAAWAVGQPERAARLGGAASALRETIGAPLTAAERADFDRVVAVVRAMLGEDEFATVWAAGRALPPEKAIAYALGEDAAPATSA